jgi:hypothetical protein
MPRYRVIGRVAPLDVPDMFGREIASGGLDISEVPIPLRFLKRGDIGFEAGLLTRLTITDDNQLEVEGTTELLAPGCYGCGIDLRAMIFEPSGEGTTVISSSVLTAVTAYGSDSGIVPTFENVHLHVELEAVESSGTHWFCQNCFADGDGEGPKPCPNCGQDEVTTFDPVE